jgi:hypothetical protein
VQAPAPGRSALEVARLLLEHGADPNAGFLWEGLSPFTALNEAFGGGEDNQPPHPECMALARLLLEHGAEANDAQTLYNRNWDPDDDWLELLFSPGCKPETATAGTCCWSRRTRPRGRCSKIS